MKVLVPVDSSENSMRAVSYAINTAKTHPHAEITLIAVACLFTNYIGENVLTLDEINVDCQNRYSSILEDAKKLFAEEGISVKTVLLQGDPAEAIIHFVENNDISKVIMGSRGMGPLKAAVLGSVTYKVLHNVKIPVTVIK